MICKHQTATLLIPEGETGVALMKRVEYAGRNCYQSSDRITDDSYQVFIRNLVRHEHFSPLEFADLTFQVTTSRAVMAELTRHRLASFQIESQRYVNYAKDSSLTFIVPEWHVNVSAEEAADEKHVHFFQFLQETEDLYNELINDGFKPEEAREILPNCTACNIIMKANLREWRHLFSLRCSPRAYPQIRSLAKDMLKQAYDYCPEVFEDLYKQFID